MSGSVRHEMTARPEESAAPAQSTTSSLPAAGRSEEETAPSIGLAWLVRVRWTIGLVELAAIAGAGWWLGPDALPVAPMLGLVAITLTSNAVLALRPDRRHLDGGLVLGSVLVLDTLTLTALLALSGGASNPFSVLYMVYVTLAAVVLGARWTWSIVLLSVGCFAGLFSVHLPLPRLAAPHFDLHLYGMFAAFALAATLIAYLVTRVARALEARETQLVHARERAARSERLASLTTLAAGAAHELGTPLGTIAVIARELERQLADANDGDTLTEDARLIRTEVDRCRAILDQLGARAGQQGGEAIEPISIDRIVEDVREGLSGSRAERFHVHREAGLPSVSLPRAAFTQVLGNLVRNAFEASDDESPVELRVEHGEGVVRFVVADRGCGMSQELVGRAVEPFFTTKETGQGMGLGLFLAQVLAERLGGRFALESVPTRGTTASMEVPV